MARYLQINYILFGTIENVATNPNNKLHPLLFLEHIHNTSQKSNYEESVFLKPKKKKRERKKRNKKEWTKREHISFLDQTARKQTRKKRNNISSRDGRLGKNEGKITRTKGWILYLLRKHISYFQNIHVSCTKVRSQLCSSIIFEYLLISFKWDEFESFFLIINTDDNLLRK